MKIRVDSNFKKVEFFAVGKEIPKVTGGDIRKYSPEVLIQTFYKPHLLIDNARIAKLPSVKRDLIIRLLEFPERIVEYDGVKIVWSDVKYPGVWGPSIDTILFAYAARSLFKKPHYLKNIHSFLEIGCGSGFLSKYILQKKLLAKKPIKYAHLMDINRDALICTMDNIEEVRAKGNTLISYSLNKPKKMIKVAQHYDLVICNPPYIPRPNSNPNNPFEGLFLYGEILKRARRMLKPESRLITNFSSLSQKDILPAFRKLFLIKSICRLKVPLKIPLITAGYSRESRRWMDYLEQNKKLIIDKSEKSGYRYWQTIEIVECRLKT